MLLASIGFKLSLAPFHMWTPDVYQGAPTPVTNFLATVSKGAMLVALTRFTIDGQLHQYKTFTLCLSVLAIISMLVGNWLALRQQQIKRLLAYSSIAHFGYLLVALVALRQLQESQQIFNSSLEAINFYITAYIITSLAAFTVVANIGGENDLDMRSFAGLFWRKPLQAGTLTVAMLSFAGIPLTAGFLGKFYLITLALNTHLWLLLITLVVGSAIGIYYYLRVIYSMLGIRSPDNDYALSRTPIPMWRDILAIILMVFVLLLGSWPQPFIDFMRHL
jgi:NADH-quinone oxidoreductase subunit N